MTDNEILRIFKETGAIIEGHFLLSSGLHSNRYFQMARVLQFPPLAQVLSAELAKKYINTSINTVIGPALGGIVLSYVLAEQLGARAIFSEREKGVMTIRRGFNIEEGENILICEDVITTGGSVSEVIDIVSSYKANIIGVCCLVQRGIHNIKFPVHYLVKMDIKNYEQSLCPMCMEKIPLVKPGSR
ncbi:MAG TPA: orotate phosphoribosyltransferase [Candidatus Ratteibacteria bacterium]|jgi:orotate phosphoribosyltransferase|uniref:Orotate phosphoribosyltransferase n=1 Tax=candidate division TA06 bacterium ADurb.Bin131 TaxID=1852827 RepID=A0A1V6CA69_UNCT6|nr:MAG: Orotate phosphoribosyltransferase [candidate division TA06 bacterium ADurb.Bin131]HOC03476.1 orotate phosphoribosyltransferase [bacterium]HRS06407.1 orotate phosphoribosyltransferase [Candidatus Ratteibacteria bacterium]HON05812.1 orotate phosphoribosyltransferase [bacterium]HPC28833.1 orotate phosphoribosyltransferase [bacterium]